MVDGRAALLATIVDGAPPCTATHGDAPGAELQALVTMLQAEERDGAGAAPPPAADAAGARTAAFATLLTRLAAASSPADLEAADAAYAALRGRPVGLRGGDRPARAVVAPGLARVEGGPPPPPPEGAAVEL